MARNRLAPVVLTVALAAVLVATLAPLGGTGGTASWGCVFCGDRALADLLVNILLFTPIGIGLGLRGTHFVRAVLAGLVISLLVESAQILIPARDASLGDIIANTLGTAAGAGIVLLAPRWLAPGVVAARRLLLSWAVLAIAMFWVTGWLLAPSFPETIYFGQWTPNLGHLDWYRGRVLEATVNGREIRSGRAPDSRGLRTDLERGHPIEVLLTAGPRTEHLASILSIYDQNRQEIVLVGPDRDDLVFRYRTRATDYRLDRPDLRLRGVMASAQPGDTLRLSAERHADGYCMRLQSTLECGIGYTVGDGWALLLYAESFPAWIKQLLRMGWLAAIAFPLGLWARRALDLAVVLALLTAALLLVPATSTLLATPWTGWVAAGVGVALGVRARSAVAGRTGGSEDRVNERRERGPLREHE
jgi:hypothetical protein